MGSCRKESVPKKSLGIILRGLIPRENASNFFYGGIAMFRTLSCQRNGITDSFSLINIMKNISGADYNKRPVISEYLTKKDEGQIAVSINAPDLHSLFRNNFTYGYDDKYDLLKRLRKSNATLRKSCLVANYISKTSLKQSIADIEKCGYLIRLQYWPDAYCGIGRDKDGDKNQSEFKDFLQRPELRSKIRERLRKETIRRIQQVNMTISGI